MKVGIIGAGRIAEAHLHAIQKIKAIHLPYIYDLKYENAESTASKFGGVPIKEFEEAISYCDAAIITSPNHCHAVQSLDILRGSKHLLCEKPMATSIEEAEKMTSLAQQASVVSSLGFNYRYLPIIRKIEKLIQEDFFSDILHFSFEFKKSSALVKKEYTWRDGPESLLTSGLWEILVLIYLIQLVIY
jgi:glucose-6-phosphate 3-dehydrogenase